MQPGDPEEHPLHTEASGAAHPEAFGPFRVLHQIGAGALGPVFRAYHPEDDRLVAIKLFKLDLPPELVHRFVAELQTLIDADLTHPGIAAPLTAGISDVTAYLAQDFVASDSLDVLAREHAPAPSHEAVRIATEIAAALDFAADANVLHGALHPRDILVSSDDARLTGLGIARALDKLGVPMAIRRPYTAPERQAGERWDRRADIFSLAAIVHELIWGRRITALGAEAASTLTPIDAADLDALKDMFARALARNPRDRFESAGEFVSELTRALAPPRGMRTSASERRLVVDEEALRLPLEADLIDEPSIPDEPEIIIERTETPAEPASIVVQEAAPALPDLADVEETRRHEETVPMLRLPAPPDDVAAVQKQETPPPVSVQGERAIPAPVAAERPVAAAASVPPPAFAALDEGSRSSLWPLALSLAIGLAVGFAAGYASGGRAGTQVSAEASTGSVSPVAQAPTVPPRPSVPETEVRVPSVPSEAPKTEAPAPRAVETPRASTPVPSRQAVSVPRPAGVVKNRTPSRPPEQARTSAKDTSTSAIMVESKPTNASVRVDGRLVGRTPLKLMSVAAGDHSIVIEHDGYRRWASSVRIVAGKPSRVTASLER